MKTRRAVMPLVLGMVLAAGWMVSAQRGPALFPVIVVFNDTAGQGSDGSYQGDDRDRSDPDERGYVARGVLGAVQNRERRHGFRADHVYGRAIRGFSARLSARQIADLEDDPSVDFVEPDGQMAIVQRGGGGGGVSVAAQVLPWGIDKIEADLSSTQAGNGSGTISNVRAYIIDTGIYAHSDLNRIQHVNFAGGTNNDCHGHGTHVSGTVAAKDNGSDVVGVAPGAPLIGVKVLNCAGSGTTSNVIKGVDWVTANAVKPAVANMSLGGGVSTALDNAIKKSVTSGVVYALAAGNSGASACNYSPSRAGTTNGVITTAATDSNDQETSWSNYGSCVDVWAPGLNIVSTRMGGGTTTMSGTSMASPHAAGAAALYLSTHTTATPAQVEAALKSFVVNGGTSKGGGALKRIVVNTF